MVRCDASDKRSIKVFISSTGVDLAEYRRAAIEVCNQLQFVPIAMEMVNYRVKNGMYIVDRLFERARLVLGAGKKSETVEIVRGTLGGKK